MGVHSRRCVLAAFPRIHLQRIRKNRDVVDSIRRIRITDDAYSIHNQTETQTVLTEWKWDSFKRFRAAEKGFCFYLLNKTFEYLPKHWLTEHEVDELRCFLPTVIRSGR
jgi:hypothetical protein